MFTNLKLIAAGIGVVAVLALAYTYYSRGEEVKTLTKENTGLTIQNEGLKDTVDTTQKSGVVTDTTVNAAVISKDEKRDSLDDVAKAADAKVDQIIREAAQVKPARPPAVKDPEVAIPPDPTAERDAKVSAVRIDSLWESYCIAVPGNAKCAPAPTR